MFIDRGEANVSFFNHSSCVDQDIAFAVKSGTFDIDEVELVIEAYLSSVIGVLFDGKGSKGVLGYEIKIVEIYVGVGLISDIFLA